MLNTLEINLLRREAEQSMTDSGKILEKTGFPDGAGGFSDGWGVVAETKCRIQSKGRGFNKMIADKGTSENVVSILVPFDCAVSVFNKIEVKGQSYDILAVLESTDLISKQLQCVVMV